MTKEEVLEKYGDTTVYFFKFEEGKFYFIGRYPHDEAIQITAIVDAKKGLPIDFNIDDRFGLNSFPCHEVLIDAKIKIDWR